MIPSLGGRGRKGEGDLFIRVLDLPFGMAGRFPEERSVSKGLASLLRTKEGEKWHEGRLEAVS